MSKDYAVAKRNTMIELANLRPQDFVRYTNDFVTIPVDDTTGNQTLFDVVLDGTPTGKIACGDALGGWLNIYTDGLDNNETYLSSGSEAFIFNTTEAALFRLRYTHSANTAGKSSFIFGLSSVVAADTLTDTGAVVSSFDGAVFSKPEDGSYHVFTTSNAATQTTANTAAWSDAGTYLIEFLYSPGDGTTGVITPMVDGVPYTSHEITISGLEEMHLLMGCKTHEAAENFVAVDYVDVIQEFNRSL